MGSAAASVDVAWIWPCRTLLLDDEAHGGQHGLGESRVVEDGRVVHERGHRPTLALEDRSRRAGRLRRGAGPGLPVPSRYAPDASDQCRTARVGSRRTLRRRCSSSPGAPCRPSSITRRPAVASAPLRLQLAGDEADRHDAVLLRRVQQPVARALPGGLVLEADLVEPGERVPHVRLVVDRQPPPAARVDVGEGAGGRRARLLASSRDMSSTIPRSQ